MIRWSDIVFPLIVGGVAVVTAVDPGAIAYGTLAFELDIFKFALHAFFVAGGIWIGHRYAHLFAKPAEGPGGAPALKRAPRKRPPEGPGWEGSAAWGGSSK